MSRKAAPSRTDLPRIWLMTDERLGDHLLAVVQALPFGSGIVFRHYGMAAAERRRLYLQVRRIARRRGHLILLADDPRTARQWGADGLHARQNTFSPTSALIRSAPVHNRRELAEARRMQADLLFMSPVYATRSHPGATPLRMPGLLRLAAMASVPVVALGGVTRAKAAMLDRCHIHGWAAIDAHGTALKRIK